MKRFLITLALACCAIPAFGMDTPSPNTIFNLAAIRVKFDVIKAGFIKTLTKLEQELFPWEKVAWGPEVKAQQFEIRLYNAVQSFRGVQNYLDQDGLISGPQWLKTAFADLDKETAAVLAKRWLSPDAAVWYAKTFPVATGVVVLTTGFVTYKTAQKVRSWFSRATTEPSTTDSEQSTM